MEVLVRILMKKKILTEKEAKEVLGEVRKEIKKSKVAEKDRTKNKKVSLNNAERSPYWFEKIKISGDLRLRNQWQETESNRRNRVRIRYRLNGILNAGNSFKIGFGFASGSGDPRSTNVTLDNTFDTKDIRLDHAYVEYSPINYMSFWAGKYKGIYSSLWEVSDLIWDDDLRPEGGGGKISFSNERFSLNLNTGFFILKERKSESDSSMIYFQPHIKIKFPHNLVISGAISYYNSLGVRGHLLKYSSETNTIDNGVLKYDYDVLSPEISVEFLKVSDPIPYFSFFGEYVYNTSPESDNEGYLGGIKFGDRKVNKYGKWQFKYMYRRLERDAWLDTFPDSDSYGGRTGIKGHEVVFKFGITKNLILGIDFYRMKKIKLLKDVENLLQTDFVWKF